MVPPESRSSIKLAASFGTTGVPGGIACGLFMAGFLKVSYFLFHARVAGRRAEVKGVGNLETAENVCPREVEAVLEHHPGIADVAFIGLPDKDRGEVVCAAIVGRGEETPGLDELRKFCRDKIGGYKIPKRMIVVEAILRIFESERAGLRECACAQSPGGNDSYLSAALQVKSVQLVGCTLVAILMNLHYVAFWYLGFFR